LLRKRFAIQPWQLLERKPLTQQDDMEPTATPGGNRNCQFMCGESAAPLFTAHGGSICNGNAVLLPDTKQLAVFNLQNGIDIYSYPDLSHKHVTHYEVEHRTSQGLASFRSRRFLASPTKAGQILILDARDASIITTLGNPSESLFQSPAHHDSLQVRQIQSRHFKPLMYG
jgi:hypothetical protein